MTRDNLSPLRSDSQGECLINTSASTKMRVFTVYSYTLSGSFDRRSFDTYVLHAARTRWEGRLIRREIANLCYRNAYSYRIIAHENGRALPNVLHARWFANSSSEPARASPSSFIPCRASNEPAGDRAESRTVANSRYESDKQSAYASAVIWPARRRRTRRSVHWILLRLRRSSAIRWIRWTERGRESER